MRKTLFYTLLAIFLLTLASCGKRKEATRILIHAQEIMETYPDSALILLDSIRLYAGRLDKNHRMQYEVTRVQARYKNYRDIKDDTAIFEARRYFLKTDDYMQQTLASLYSGCVYEERSEYEPAMNAYKEAFESATMTGDSLIMGRIQHCIGTLLYSQGFHKEALNPFRKAVVICKSLPDKQAEYYGDIGICFILMEENDSAFHYYKEGIRLTEQTGNMKTQSRLLQNMSVLYGECMMYEEALSALRQSLQVNPDSIIDPHYNMNFAELFMLTNQNDSLSHYINILKNDLSSITDRTLLASSYSVLSEYARLNKDSDSVFHYQSEYYKITENIYQERLQQSVYEIQQKYDFEAEQNKYNVMLLKRRNRIIALTILFSISVICFCLYSINRHKKESALLNELLSLEHKNKELNNQRDDLKQEIDILKKEQTKFEKQNNEGRINEIQSQITQLSSKLNQTTLQLRKNISWQTALMHKVLVADKTDIGKTSQFKQLRKYVYGESDSPWEAMIVSIEKLYPNLSQNIKIKFPNLNENEFRVCIITFAPLSVQDIADILDISVNTVGKIRSNIRKKLQMEKSRGDISEHILKILE